MFVSHASRELLFRLVVTGERGSGAPAVVDAAHAIFGQQAPTTRGAGTWSSRDYSFTPQGLEPVHGYTIRMLLHGLDSAGPGTDPCDLSGFRDVDGLLVVGAAGAPDALAATLARCAGYVGALGYDVSGFPLVVGALGGGDVTGLAARFGLGNRPVLPLVLEDTRTTAGAVKACLKQMLVALKEDRIRTVHGTPM